MFKIRLKKRFVSTLVGALVAAPLGLIPAAANASTIATGAEGVYDWGSLRWDPRLAHNEGGISTSGDLGEDGLTKFTVDFGTDWGDGRDEGTWLLMNASSSDPNEEISFKLLNRSSLTINNLWLEFRTVNGESLGAIADRPTLAHWAATISDSSATVDVVAGSSSIDNGDSYQRVNLVFSPVMPNTYSGQMTLNTSSLLAKAAGFGGDPLDPGTWVGFNPNRGPWWFNIDPNQMNLNGPPQVPTPIPGAVWLLGSALLGLVARSNRRRRL